MLYTISNGTYTAQVDSLGAQLVSLKGPDGWEYIWTGDPAYWTGHAPVLFPMVGGLRGGRAKIAGDWHQMGRHGFARHQEFALAEQGEGRLVLRLESNPATLEAYPFPCALTVAYTLTENGYETAFTVENTGDKPMPYAIGGHPGFNIPVDEQAAFEDYVIRFEKEETQRCPGIVGDKLLDYSQITLELEGEREIPLRHELFARDALIFENLNSHTVALVNPATGKGVETEDKVSADQFTSVRVQFIPARQKQGTGYTRSLVGNVSFMEWKGPEPKPEQGGDSESPDEI